MEVKRSSGEANWRVYNDNNNGSFAQGGQRHGRFDRARDRSPLDDRRSNYIKPVRRDDWTAPKQQNVRHRDADQGSSGSRGYDRPKSQPSNNNDCEIIVVSKSLTKYAEMIESQLKRLGLSVDLLFPNINASPAEVLSNISSRGTLYAVLITPRHEEQCSVALSVLYGNQVDYSNMPLKDALEFICTNFQQKLAADVNNVGGFDGAANPLQVLFNLLSNSSQSPIFQNPDGERKYRMSGSQTKRFQHFKRKGFSDEEAFEKSREVAPWNRSKTRDISEFSRSTKNEEMSNNKNRMSGSQTKRFKYFKRLGFSDVEAREKSRLPMNKRRELFESNHSEEVKTAESRFQKKRFHYFKSKGFSDEEALEKIREVVPRNTSETRAQQNKRISPDKSTSQTQTLICSNATFIDDTSSVKLGILPKGFPNVLLNTENMKRIEKNILQKISQMKDYSTKPAFIDLSFASGYMIFTCKDRATADWLKSFKEDSIRIVEQGDLPYSQIMTGFFPNSKALSAEDIFCIIQEQNEGIVTTQWKVCKRTEEGDLSHLILSIDESSIELLIRKNFWINYKSGTVSLVTTIFDGLSE